MRCRYCRAFPTYGSISLVNGCSNLKQETLTKHSKSKSHVYCRDCYLTRTGKSKAATRQEALLEILARQEMAQWADLQRVHEIKFNAAYKIAKEELPFTKFPPLLLPHKKNGVDISPTYDNDVKCAQFISSICESMKSDLCDRLLKSTWYASIIIGGDKDISIKECEMVHTGKNFKKTLVTFEETSCFFLKCHLQNFDINGIFSYLLLLTFLIINH